MLLYSYGKCTVVQGSVRGFGEGSGFRGLGFRFQGFGFRFAPDSSLIPKPKPLEFHLEFKPKPAEKFSKINKFLRQTIGIPPENNPKPIEIHPQIAKNPRPTIGNPPEINPNSTEFNTQNIKILRQTIGIPFENQSKTNRKSLPNSQNPYAYHRNSTRNSIQLLPKINTALNRTLGRPLESLIEMVKTHFRNLPEIHNEALPTPPNTHTTQ